MLCDYKIIKKESLETSIWSGGTTTQLSIFPENAKYQDRNFVWRLSSATVEEETSEFTNLPDYNRILMILSGKLELNHNDKEIINLNAFDQNEFDGANKTKSYGKVVDFNLMMRKDKCSGKVKAVSIDKKEKTKINEIIGFYSSDNLTLAVYNYKSNMEITIEEHIKASLNHGDLLLVNFKEQISNLEMVLENLSDEDGKIIITQIFY